MNFYRFDSVAGQWNELAKVTGPDEGRAQAKTEKAQKQSAEDLNEAEADDRRPKKPVRDPHGASSCGMQVCDALKAGALLSTQDAPLYEKLYESDSAYNRQKRVADQNIELYEKLSNTGKSRMDSLQDKIRREKHVYKLQMVKDGKSKVIFNLVCDPRGNSELEALKNISWQYAAKGAPRYYAAAFKKGWTKCVVSGTGNDYKIALSDERSEVALQNLQLKFKERVRKKERDAYLRSAFESYAAGAEKHSLQMAEMEANRQAMQEQYRRYAAQADSLTKAQNREDWIHYLFNSTGGSGLCFWQWNKEFMSADEQRLDIQQWCRYFDEHKKEMSDRYTQISGYNRECGPMQRSEIVCIIPMQYRYRMEVDRRSMDSLTNSLMETANIRMMGIYNFDVPEQIENREEILAEFKDAEGKEVRPDYVFMIDNAVNGLMSYDQRDKNNPYTFDVMRTSYISLIAIDKNRVAYVCSAKRFEAARSQKGKGARTIVLDKLRNIKDKKTLEKLL